MKIILLGPPGAGKGTQSVKLQRYFGIPGICVGDLLRSERLVKTLEGEVISNAIKSGKLVPDNLVTDLVFKKIRELPDMSNYILDGFPRTLRQAETLFEKFGSDFFVFNFVLTDSEIIKRIEGRRKCLSCALDYNLYYSPPLALDVCDRCGGLLIQREDDVRKVVENRLEIYHNNSKPLIEYYSKLNLLRNVCVEVDSDAVFLSILEELRVF